MAASSPALQPERVEQPVCCVAKRAEPHKCTLTKDRKLRTQAHINFTEIVGFCQNRGPPVQKKAGEPTDFFFLWVCTWFGKEIA